MSCGIVATVALFADLQMHGGLKMIHAPIISYSDHPGNGKRGLLQRAIFFTRGNTL